MTSTLRIILLIGAAVMLAVFAACGDDDDVDPNIGRVPGRPCGDETPGPEYADRPTITFGSGSQALHVEVANDPGLRARGLSQRGCLGDNWGMLFVYPKDSQGTFGMRSTLIPLSIAWIDADGKIMEIEDMEPRFPTGYTSPAPYRYTIETNQGWFDDHGVKAGDSVPLPPNLSAS